MFDKLSQAQSMAEEIKRKLDLIEVEGEAGNGKVKVIANANRRIKDVIISDEMMHPERKEELQDLVQIAFEKAMKTAEDISQSEMNALMSSMMPGGLGSLFGKK
ncbi:MAG: YbaB/EbfC family nucleoid-associated protein [Bacteroidia bacterium]